MSSTNADAATDNPAEGGLVENLEQFDGIDCPNPRVPYLLGLNNTTRKALFFRPRCKMWACPVCGKANAWAWSFRANEGAHKLYDSGKSLAFVTLTPHEKLTPGQSWWVMPRAWMKLQARLRRAVGPFEYFTVPELHDSTKVHMHFMTTAIQPRKWWKDNGRECGFGYQNDSREVWELGGIVGYFMKYLTKGLTVGKMPPRTRRVRTSRGWPKLGERDPPPDWEFTVIPQQRSLQTLVTMYDSLKYEIIFAGSKTAWKYVEPPEL